MKKLRIILLFLPLFCFGQNYKTSLIHYNGGIIHFNGGVVFQKLPVYNEDAVALFNRMNIQPSEEEGKNEKFIYSEAIDSMQYYSIWDSLHCIYGASVATEQAAKLNWKGDTFNLVGINSPTFDDYYGFTGNETDKYFKTGYIPANYSEYNRLSASFGISIDSLSNVASYHGVSTTASGNTFIVPNIGGSSYGRINSGTNSIIDNTNLSRTNIYTVNYLQNSQYLIIEDSITSNASVAVANPVDLEIYLLARNNLGSPLNFSGDNLNFGFIGNGLTLFQVSKLQEIINRFNTRMRDIELLASIHPDSSATSNTVNFQALLDGGNKTISIQTPGTYKFNSTLFIDDNTTINFSDNVIFQKDAVYSNCFINRGALTKEFNYNIAINGMTLAVNGYETDPEWIWGGRGQLQFFYIDGLTITDFYCDDLGSFQFCIEAVKWRNLYYDNIYIEGHKDGLDFLTGNNGVVKNVTLKTFDDGVFMGGIGFPTAMVEAIGDVHDMSFSNISYIDSAKVLPARAFLFYLGSWDIWRNDSIYKTGDFVTTNNNIYQVANTNGFSATASIEPTHTSGFVTGADGINWHQVDTGSITKAEVYNISIDNSFLYNPYGAITATYTDNAFMRTIYPGTEGNAKARNISLTNSYISNTVAIRQQTGIIDVTLEGSTFDSLTYLALNYDGIDVGDSLYIKANNNHYQYCDDFITTDDQRIFYESDNDSYASSNFVNSAPSTGTIRAINYDLPFTGKGQITPVLNDTCRFTDGLHYWNGSSWILIP